jgi:hypothetical protein
MINEHAQVCIDSVNLQSLSLLCNDLTSCCYNVRLDGEGLLYDGMKANYSTNYEFCAQARIFS